MANKFVFRKPLIEFCGGYNKIALSPLLRFLAASCCEDDTYASKRNDPSSPWFYA
jgi:hypothetical protein